MTFKETINNIQKIDYSKYATIKGDGRFIAYTAYQLKELGVPLTFNYLCIAAFKFFPDILCCDEEFKEFPSVDKLNRAMMHAKYVQNGKPFITGTTEKGYELTSYGKTVAMEMISIFNNMKVDKSIKAPVVDQHKKGFGHDYSAFVNSEGYKKYLEDGKIDEKFIWKYYKVTPYTQIKKIQDNLKLVSSYAENQNDEKCIEFIDKILKLL